MNCCKNWFKCLTGKKLGSGSELKARCWNDSVLFLNFAVMCAIFEDELDQATNAG